MLRYLYLKGGSWVWARWFGEQLTHKASWLALTMTIQSRIATYMKLSSQTVMSKSLLPMFFQKIAWCKSTPMATTLNSLIVSLMSDVMIELLPKPMATTLQSEDKSNFVRQPYDGTLRSNWRMEPGNGFRWAWLINQTQSMSRSLWREEALMISQNLYGGCLTTWESVTWSLQRSMHACRERHTSF